MEKQTISVAAFSQGLKSQTVAGQVAVLAKNSTAQATRIASELSANNPNYAAKMFPRQKTEKAYKRLAAIEPEEQSYKEEKYEEEELEEEEKEEEEQDLAVNECLLGATEVWKPRNFR